MAEFRLPTDDEVQTYEGAPEEGALTRQIVGDFECITCHIVKPDKDFYFDTQKRAGGKIVRVRRLVCRECTNKQRYARKLELQAGAPKLRGGLPPQRDKNSRPITTKSKSSSSGYNRTKIKSSSGYHLDGMMINKLRRWGDRLWAAEIKFDSDFMNVNNDLLSQILPSEGIKIIRQAYNQNDTDILDHVFRYDRPYTGLVPVEAAAKSKEKEQPLEPLPEPEHVDYVTEVKPPPPPPASPPAPPPVMPDLVVAPNSYTDDDIEALARIIIEAGDEVDKAEKMAVDAKFAYEESLKALDVAIQERRRAIAMFRERME
jgi:hypothetical protein